MWVTVTMCRSRDFLRPIFKWMKSSSSYCDKEKPFSFLVSVIFNLAWKIQDLTIAFRVSENVHIYPEFLCKSLN